MILAITIIGIVFLVGVVKIILYPLYIATLLKLKHGDKVKMLYYPLYGALKHMIRGLRQHDDIIQYKREAAYNTNAELIITNILDKPYYIFIDVGLAKQVFQEYKLYTKRQDELFADITHQQGIVFSEGDQWKQQRIFLAQHFSYQALLERVPLMKQIIKETLKFEENTRIPIITECSKVAMKFMKASFFNDYNDDFINGKPFCQELLDIGIELTSITYSSVWHQIRGLFGCSQSSRMYSFLQTKQEKLLLQRVHNFREFILKMIDERLNDPDSLAQQTNLISSMVKQYKNTVTTQQLKELILQQYATFIFAGTDTTSHMAAMAIFQLAKNPEIQEQLRSTVIDIDYTKLEGAQVVKLELLEAFLNESLRLSVPTDGIIPRIALQDHFVGPYLIKKGSFVDVGIQPILTHPKYFDEHLEFKMERWLPGFGNQAFIPFSGGPRNCIGQHLARMEIKLILIYILQNYIVVPDQEKLVMKYGFLYEPQDERLVQFKSYYQVKRDGIK